MKLSFTVFAGMLAMVVGCAQPSPPCLILPATGFVNYAVQYRARTIRTSPVTANCDLFDAPVDLATAANDLYPAAAAIVGGLPFRVGQLGFEKFAPTGPGAASVMAMAPDVLQGASINGSNAYTQGPLQSEDPDENGLCYVTTFAPVTADFDWGGTVGVRSVTFAYSNLTVYNTATAPGTQIRVEVDVTIATPSPSLPESCTAGFTVVGYAPSATCVIIEDDLSIAGGGVEPLTDTDVQTNLCTDFNPPQNDQTWINYGNYGAATGAGVNRYFPLACDTPSGYCVLTGDFPAYSTTPRP